MLRKRILAGIAASGLLALTLATVPNAGLASSHREAPLISKDPEADNTDLYAFVSPDKLNTVTIIANYIPLEEPAGGPNFAAFDDAARYEIHIDNDGDAKDDITYQFQFKTKIRNPNTFLYNTNTINSLDDPDWNMPQMYDVTRISDGKSKRIGDNIPTPPVNVGPRSTPNYEALAAAAVKKIDGNIMVFAGQRDDPFYVDLGSIFDLGGLRPFNSFHLAPLATAPGVDGVGGYNTHTIAIQVPIDQLTRDGEKANKTKMPVLGIYASASRMSRRVLRDDGSQSNNGKYVQVSRLGNPLINEVIIPLGKKDYWNAQDPSKDKQFQKYYETPELAGLINLLYPALPDTRTSDRTDLSLILLTGVPGLNFTGKTPADLLRLNVAVKPTADVGKGDVLGVLNGDTAGFPNGRRLEDDVTDIELRAVADGYGTFLNTNFGLPNLSPNNTVGDGVNENDMEFLPEFPYVATPHQGYEHTHHMVGSGSTPAIK
ncbi:MAG: DUF4331 domain-containing protein [Roseiflexaceae bacterium]